MIVGYIATQPQKDRRIQLKSFPFYFFGGLPKTINLPYKRDKNDEKNQAIRRSNMGFLLLLVALACTLLRLGRTGPGRKKSGCTQN